MAGSLPDGLISLDGLPTRVLEIRDRHPGRCPHCTRSNLTALLIGSPEKGAHREWVMVRRVTAKTFLRHHCKDLEQEARVA